MSKERLLFKVVRGALVPYSEHTVVRMREMALAIDDVVSIEVYKPRHAGFWGLAHRLGDMCAKQIDYFKGKSAHEVLKTLQLDSRTKCEETQVDMPGIGRMVFFKPQSLAYDAMDQTEFFEVMQAMCRHIAEKHWPNLTAKQVAEMSGCMLEER